MEGKATTRTVPGNGSEQTGESLLPGHSWGLGGCCRSAPQVLPPLPVALGRSRGRRQKPPRCPGEMRGGSRPRQGHGRPRGRTRAQARAPRVARALLLSTDSGGAAAPQAAPRRSPTLARRPRGSRRPANRTHPATCDVQAEPRRAQGRRGSASARAATARSTSVRGAGGRWRARG